MLRFLLFQCAVFALILIPSLSYAPSAFADDEQAPLPPPAESTPAAAESSQPAGITLADCGARPPVVDDEQWTLFEDESFINFIGDGRRYYILPGRGHVWRIPESQRSQRDVRLALAAVGSAAFGLVTRDGERAIAVDFGRSVTLAVKERQFQALAAGTGVRTISHTHITHGHQDHVNDFEQMVRRYRIPERNVVVQGFAVRSSPVLSRAWESLAQDQDPAIRRLGYRPGGPVSNHFSLDPTGRYLFARFRQGGLIFEHVANREAVRSGEAALEAGRAPTAQTIDAASSLIAIGRDGKRRANRIMVTGDFRYRDLLDLERQMGRDAFERHFRDVRQLMGIGHHAGVIGSTEDVRGLERLLELTLHQQGRLSAAVQTSTGPTGQALRPHIEALRHLGVDVVLLDKPSARSDPSWVELTSRGEVRQIAGPAAVRLVSHRDGWQMVRRVQVLSDNIERIDSNRELLEGMFGRRAVKETRGRLAAGITELREAHARRVELTAGRITGGREAARAVNFDSPQLREALRKNAERSLRRTEFSREFSASEFGETLRILGAGEAANARLNQLVKKALSEGRTTPELRSMLEFMESETRRELLNREPSKRRILRELRNVARARGIQGPAARDAPAGQGLRSPRVQTGVMAAVIAAQIAADALEFHKLTESARKHRAAASGSKMMWWLTKKALPEFRGVTDGFFGDSYSEDIRDVVRGLSAESLAWVELERPGDPETLIPFMAWLEDNVQSFEHFQEHFVDDRGSAVRYRGTFPDGTWEVYTSSWSGVPIFGGAAAEWVELAEGDPLLPILSTMMERVQASTDQDVAAGWSRRVRGSGQPPAPLTTTVIPVKRWDTRAEQYFRTLRPTRRTRFKAGRAHSAYSHLDPVYRILGGAAGFVDIDGQSSLAAENFWRTDDPYFLVYENDPPPQAGLVIVGGADAPTYTSLRSAETFQFEIESNVYFPKPEYHWFFRWSVINRTDQQRAAIEDTKEKDINSPFTARLVTNPDKSGVVQYWYWGSNHRALAAVRYDDLEFDEEWTAPPGQPVPFVDIQPPEFEAPPREECGEPEPEDEVSAAPAGGAEACRAIDCDCDGIDFGLLTGAFREECRIKEEEAINNCLAGRTGMCDIVSHGPNAHPLPEGER